VALGRHAPDDAALLWQDALAAAEIAAATSSERFELALGLARSWYAAGRFDEGYEAVERALSLVGDDHEKAVAAADVAMGHGVWVPFRYGADVSVIGEAMDRAVAELPSSTSAWPIAQSVRAVVLAQTGGESQVDPVSSAAVEAAAGHDDPALLQRVLHLRLLALRGQDFAEQRAETARRLLGTPDLPAQLEVIARLHMVFRLVEQGELASARTRLESLDAPVAALHNPALALQVAVARAGLDLFQGVPDAGRHLAPATTTLSFADLAYFEVTMLAVRAETLVQEDRLDEEFEWVEEMWRLTGLPGFAHLLASALADRGEHERARRLLRETPEPPRDYQWAITALSRLHAAIRLGEIEIVREVHDAFSPYAGQFLVNGTCTTIDGAYDGHLGEALLALGEPEGARAHLSAAVEMLERAGAAYWLARARQALAKCP